MHGSDVHCAHYAEEPLFGPGPLASVDQNYPRHQSCLYLKPVLAPGLRELAQGAERQGLGEVLFGDDLSQVGIVLGMGAKWGQGLCPQPTEVIPGTGASIDDLARQMGFAGAKIAINTKT